MAIPWGEDKGDEDMGGYHLVWTRDMVQTATALLASGHTETPSRALIYLATCQQEDGGFPQNFWLNGEPYWRGVQLDQISFPILLAWRMNQIGALSDFDPYSMVMGAARKLMLHGPATSQERWEEASGYSPSTLAVNIASLVCAACLARQRGDQASAQFMLDHADFLESHVEKWTVTTQGTLGPGIARHHIRINPVNINDWSPDENPNTGSLVLANRAPGSQYLFAAKEIVDAEILELVRYGGSQGRRSRDRGFAEGRGCGAKSGDAPSVPAGIAIITTASASATVPDTMDGAPKARLAAADGRARTLRNCRRTQRRALLARHRSVRHADGFADRAVAGRE